MVTTDSALSIHTFMNFVVVPYSGYWLTATESCNWYR